MSAFPPLADEFVDPPPGAPRTVAEALGQILWLMTQSRLHRELPIKSFEHSFMPAILKEQFRIFRFGPTPGLSDVPEAEFAKVGLTKSGLETMPLGVAIWAWLSPAAEAKLEKGAHLTLEEWRSGDRLWLVEMLSPFATSENKLSEIMLADLLQGPFAGSPVALHRTDPKTRKREKLVLDQHLKTTRPH